MNSLASYFAGTPMLRTLNRFNQLASAMEKELTFPSLALDWGIERTDVGYAMEIDVPGLTREDIEVEVTEGNVVTVKGERKTRNRVSSVYRAMTFPIDANMDTVKASIDNGILTVECERLATAEKKSRTVRVE